MGLVIKITGADAQGGSKLYRDALVSTGTLILQDFSNKGTLDDFSLAQNAPVHDLSRDVSKNILNINNFSNFNHNASVTPALTNGKGLDTSTLGINTGGALKLGINYKRDLLDYLGDNPNNNILLICWVRSIAVGTGTFVTSTNTDNLYPIRMHQGSSNIISITLAGTAGPGTVLSNDVIAQVGVEFTGIGNELNCYLDGNDNGQSDNVATGFGTPNSDLVLGKIDTIQRGGIMYRWLIEDLTVSGRTAAEVVQDDWEYCNGIGKYAGTNSKRPFITEI